MLNRMEMLRVFLVAVEAPSFREAAHRLGISPQKVTRAIKELERTFAEPLFHRSTRQATLTAFGAEIAQQARETLNQFDRLFLAHSKPKNAEIAGRVGITAPHAIGKLYLADFLKPLMHQHPGLRIELNLDDQLTDAVLSRIDIGIRIGAVRDRRFIARAVAQVPLKVVAAPALVEAVGAPSSVEALKSLPLSVLIDRNNGRPWPWFFSDGESYLPPSPAFSCDDPETELEFVLSGLAFAQMPHYLAEPHVSEGSLVEVLAHCAPPTVDLIVYRTQSGPVPPRVRLVYDHLIACLSDEGLFPRRSGHHP
ncbi:DNA-binding transcriptional regulator, LysR family [Pseudomonas sp. NFACC02]|uniref:LysR family transcriptional regulator n=1 Tax=Pseudomonas sp. NFACC02 TaxID=1566250 RepID=UPI0008B04670|nr:LysR family transcriptional regulator [Pseudomonas sp. NFACC02]SER57096.1 DNA-binding transcriptional regulator, LysR family [Pseudomonas sp. NFACC02]